MRLKFKWIFTLLVALTMQFSYAQEKTITGKVTDATGPLPGVNVVVKGTTRNASTNNDGKYSISAKAGETLVFSYIGMSDKTATVGAGSVYNTKLEESAKSLDAVLVTGSLGIKKSKNATTTAQQVVSAKELTQAANPNVIQSLAGKVSGLQISTTSSGVNSSTRIVLRGFRTISGNAEALVVIDEAISTAAILSQLAPEVIESINVIKGQQGSALYGEQGSNGVIIVTTKKGTKSSKPVITLSSSMDFENIAFTPDRQTKYGQGWFNETGVNFQDPVGPNPQQQHIPFENGSWGPAFNNPLFAGTLQATGLPQADGKFLRLPYVSQGSNNVRDFFKTGVLLQNGVSLNMGGEDGYALISLNRQNTDYIVDGDKLARTSFLFKGGKKMGKFSLGGSASYSVESVSQTDQNLYFDLLNTATNIPVSVFSNPSNQNHWTVYNKSPYWKQQNVRFDDAANTINANAKLGYEFSKHFNVSYNGSVGYSNSINQFHNNGDSADQQYNIPDYSFSINYLGLGGTTVGSSYFVSDVQRRTLYGDLIFNFDYALTDKIGFKANVGNNIQDNDFSIQTSGGTGIVKPGIYNVNNLSIQNAVNFDNLSQASYTPYKFFDTLDEKLDNRSTRLRKVAVFANADFNYEDYLFLNLTDRIQKTSNVAGTSNYYSGGLSFVPTLAIDALKNGKILNFTKVFLNYSLTGNTTPVQSQATVGDSGTSGDFSGSFLSPVTQTDQLVRPEFVRTTEAGIQLGFFNNRITLGATVYNSLVTDLITLQTVSSTSGFRNFRTNIGNIENKGYDFDFGFVPLKSESFRWEIKSNLSFNSSKVTSLSPGVNEVSLNTTTGAGVFAVLGEEFPMIKGTTYERDPEGRVIVRANGTPIIETSGLKNLGKATPDYVLGITNSFEYKGLKLTAVVDYRSGGKFYSITKRDLAFTGALMESAEFDRAVGYVFPNSVQLVGGAYVPNTTVINGGGINATGAFFSSSYLNVGENNVVDATFFKIREIALSYSLPSKAVAAIGLSSFRVGVNARNLFTALGNPFKSKGTYTNQGFADPESSNAAATKRNANAIGIVEQTQYPSTKTVGFSINLTF
jgi:TonB-linked SusC/RagA family outer membrane protein